MHQIKNILKLAQSHNLHWCLDESSLVEINGLGRIFSVSDVGTLDGDHAEDGAENGSLEERVGG
jgi:hypothetical protein